MSVPQNHDNRKARNKYDDQKRNYYQNGMRYPDRWTKYGTIGAIIPGSKFIAFKTPLSDEFFIGKPETPFGLKDVVETVAASGKKLGLVIDLTNTKRYYEAADWSNFGVEYKKIFCPGHTIHKNEDLVEEFITFVSEFLSKNDDADLVIGVHCTHGLNRTGFLICKYLISKENWVAEEAVKAFEEARGHEIERLEYKATLLGQDIPDQPEAAPESSNSRKRGGQKVSAKKQAETKNSTQTNTGRRTRTQTKKTGTILDTGKNIGVGTSNDQATITTTTPAQEPTSQDNKEIDTKEFNRIVTINRD